MNRSRYKGPLPIVVIGLIDILLVNVSFLLAYWVRFYLGVAFTQHPVAPINEYLKALLIIDYLFLFLFIFFGLYQRRFSVTLVDELNAILKAVSLGIILIVSLSFFYREFSYSRLVSLYTWCFSVVFLSSFRYILQKWEFAQRNRGEGLKKVILVGATNMAEIIYRKICENPHFGYHVIGYVQTDENSSDLSFEESARLGKLSDFSVILESNVAEEVFITDPQLEHFDLLTVIDACEERRIPVMMIPSLYDLLINYEDVRILDGFAMVSLSEHDLSQLSAAIKRCFDVSFSLMMLTVFSPLLLVIAILIRLRTGGPAIFKQIRAGQYSKPFTMYKFRTMKVDAEDELNKILSLKNLEEPVFKLKDDPRVTDIGRFLRRTSLDEFPQFVNVLLGQMSVVGPRPEELKLVQEYNIWQSRRLKVKPGITGLQQIYCRGSLSLAERVKYDIYYIRKQSMLLDLLIILKTIKVVITGEGAM